MRTASLHPGSGQCWTLLRRPAKLHAARLPWGCGWGAPVGGECLLAQCPASPRSHGLRVPLHIGHRGQPQNRPWLRLFRRITMVSPHWGQWMMRVGSGMPGWVSGGLWCPSF